MKNYISREEGVWNEILNPQVTEEQLVVLQGEESDAKSLLIESIRQASSVVVEDTTELVALYNSVKPTLKEGDVYTLISINVTNNRGILNCRVNGIHTQIRF